MQNVTARQVLKHLLSDLSLIAVLFSLASAQPTPSIVPTLVNFSGTVTDVNGKPLGGTVGVTFYLYKDQQGGAPLWIETQNVQPDRFGHYSVMLGATKSQGLPTGLFASGEARWLEVQAEGQAEQPRVMLLAVPYALKAGDAATVGGLPPSAFVLAAPPATGGSSAASAAPSLLSSPAQAPPVGGSGTTGYLAGWVDNSGDLGNSILFQKGTGAGAMIGLNLKSPLANLDVNGTELVRGLFESATTGVATATKGFNSNPTDLEASSFNSSTNKAVMQHFEWQAEPTGNNTTAPGATLNLLFATDTNKPAETGLKLSKTGVFTFAAGQTFPGTGTITGITAGTDLTGGGSSGTVTLNLDTSKVPQLATNNTFTGAQTINSNVAITASGSFSALAVTANGNLDGIIGIADWASGYGIAGIATATTGGAGGVYGTTAAPTGSGVTGVASANTAIGVLGTNTNGTGVFGMSTNASGMLGQSAGPGAAGVFGFNTVSGYGLLGFAKGTSGQGVWGESFGTSFSNGAGADGVHGVSHTISGSGVAGINTAKDATGIYGSDTNGYGFVTDSHTSQGRGAGGWVKAMVYFEPTGGGIKRCFNSQLAGSQASIVPCGITFSYNVAGEYNLDFGFEVDDRFASLTMQDASTVTATLCRSRCFFGPTSNQLEVQVCQSDQNPCTLQDGAAGLFVVVY